MNGVDSGDELADLAEARRRGRELLGIASPGEPSGGSCANCGRACLGAPGMGVLCGLCTDQVRRPEVYGGRPR